MYLLIDSVKRFCLQSLRMLGKLSLFASSIAEIVAMSEYKSRRGPKQNLSKGQGRVFRLSLTSPSSRTSEKIILSYVILRSDFPVDV